MVISLSSLRWPTRIARVILMNPRCLVLWTSVCYLARGKDVFAIMPTGFGRSLIFQLFPRLAKAALTLENSTTIVVSPLISIMTYNARPSGTTEKAWIFGRSYWHRRRGRGGREERERRKVRNCFLWSGVLVDHKMAIIKQSKDC